MKRKLLVLVVVTVLAISTVGCGKKSKSTSSSEETVENKEDLSLSSTEKIEQSKEVKTLKELADQSTDGKINRLITVANDSSIGTTDDADVTYLFEKDDNNNRILGSVLAYYTSATNYGTSDKSSYCDDFVKNNFPELSSYLSNAEVYDDSQGFGKIIEFDDYSVTLMPDNDCNGISVVLSKN